LIDPAMNAPLAIIRASSWPNLFDCAHRWYWQQMVGLHMPSSGAATIGKAVHAGTSVFDVARMKGERASIDDAVDAARDFIAHPDEPVAWDEECSPAEANAFAVRLTAKYCSDIAPTRTYAAIETRCDALDINTSHGLIRVTGTVDRIRVLPDGRRGISDLKTGARATEKTDDGGRRAVTKGHHLQLGVYTLMAEQATGLAMDAPAEIIGLQTTKEAPCATGEIADVKTPLLGTPDGQVGLIEMAAHMLSEGLFPPNPKSFVCSAKYCPAYASHCKYHD
jgi:hypothetical protein